MSDLLWAVAGYGLVLLMFGFIATVHEFGHYWAFKRYGVVPEEFSVGFGKVLWQRQWRGTLWSIRLVPFGGYVEPPEEFCEHCTLSPWQGTVVALAGPTVNLVAGILCFWLYAMFAAPGIFAHGFWAGVLTALVGAIYHVLVKIPAAMVMVLEMMFNWDILKQAVPSNAAKDLLSSSAPVVLTILTWGGGVSAFIGWLNLLPFLPFDGGRVVQQAVRAMKVDLTQGVGLWFRRGSLAVGGILVLALVASNLGVIGADLIRAVVGMWDWAVMAWHWAVGLF